MRNSVKVLTGGRAESSATKGRYVRPKAGTRRILSEVLADIARDLVTVDLGESSATPGRDAGPTTGTERMLAEVLAGILRVERVPVDSHVFNDLGADSMVMAGFCAQVRKRADLPSVSMKDVYRHPTIRELAAALAPAPVSVALPSLAGNPVEAMYAEVLAGVLKVDHVAVESHVFDDLGADSMVMAQFCARVRKRADLPPVSMKDIYRNPTIRGLAAALATTPAREAVLRVAPDPVEPAAPAPAPAYRRASSFEYLLCGALQFLFFVAYCTLVANVLSRGYNWIDDATSVPTIYLRSVVFGGATLTGMCVLPIVAKWLLVGRWKAGEVRIWSLGYLRFWLVKTLDRSNPLALLFIGTPLYTLYLRALGAKIGHGVVILTKHLPVCTDLITIGDGTIIRRDAYVTGYRAHAGMIQMGPVTIGKRAFVGDHSILDIHTSIGDDAQLGMVSALYSGQAVPAGERWHGSPAEPTDVNYQTVPPAATSRRRRVVFTVREVLTAVLVYVPMAIGGIGILLTVVPQVSDLVDNGPSGQGPLFYAGALVASLVLYLGLLFGGLLAILTLPRLLNLFIKPDRIYPLYGFHYSINRAVTRFTNSAFFMNLFGDSSFIVYYLRAVGYDLGRVKQTGSNFGTVVSQDNPYLTRIGRGTMIADGLHINNTDFGSTSFRVSRVTIGEDNFLGNGIVFPPQARTGNDVLLATKVMVPIEGEIREGVGLLGSPCFEIPRRVERDNRAQRDEDEQRRLLAVKNRYNFRTLCLAITMRWIYLFGVTLLGMVTANLYQSLGPWAVAMEIVLFPLYTTTYFVLVERALTWFRPIVPQYCSIYDPYFWWHERYWKLMYPGMLNKSLSGTPFKVIIYRALGAKIGKRVYDDGCDIPERTLAVVGDDCTLNAEGSLHCHSQEDGVFKSDRVILEKGCTMGIGALVHYGSRVGEGAIIAPDSFVMKGEEVPPHSYWGGNPAEQRRPDEFLPAAPAAREVMDTELIGRAASPRRIRAYRNDNSAA